MLWPKIVFQVAKFVSYAFLLGSSCKTHFSSSSYIKGNVGDIHADILSGLNLTTRGSFNQAQNIYIFQLCSS